ncbi:ATP/GTP-binding protein [Stetteria hydrogenophila]
METKFIVITGPAGSGKSLLTAELADYMQSQGAFVARVNLDPAVATLPYDPDVDIRDYVKYEKYLTQNLGPNGALIAAVDEAFNYASDIRKEIDDINPEYAIIDTPGQLELFAFRVGGPLVLDAIIAERPVTLVFLMDAVFFERPSSIVSALMLASSVTARLLKPQINVVSKADLLLEDVKEEIIPNLSEPGFLIGLLEREDIDWTLKSLLMRLAEALYDSGVIGEVLPVSIKERESLGLLYAKIQQILAGGDDYTAYREL